MTDDKMTLREILDLEHIDNGFMFDEEQKTDIIARVKYFLAQHKTPRDILKPCSVYENTQRECGNRKVDALIKRLE